MNRNEYKQLIAQEVYFPYSQRGKVNLFLRIWCKYLRPESNALYLIRKYQLNILGKYKLQKAYGKLLEICLLRRYGIYIHPNADIGIGLRIYHPHGIFITNAKIGKNFTIFQNCTIGVKKIGEFERDKCPHIGNDVIMYANSSVIGSVIVADKVEIACNACLVSDADEQGVYAGISAKLR